MMTVRVTRLMEYEYPNLEQAISGMEAWQVPPNGARSYGKISAQPGGLMIRSAVIGPVFGETAEQIADMTAVRGDLDEDPSIERAEEMRRELAGVMGINPTAPASLWEEMLRMIGAAGSVAPDVHADLVRRARDLVAALDDAGAVTVARGKPNNITIYRDRLRHWLQTYTAGLPAHMVAPDPTVGELEEPTEPGRAHVVLFKDSGKYYTQEDWAIPEGAMGPWDMGTSIDFRRIGDGAVLVPTQEPWGYPFLLV